ncbi:metallophosphoesterase family protein [Metabacillus litoralis]|uniref:metallophosphoesterase family protein n=1 Tax=Metabacillus litoralis TaxID=152268 RepID=UPI001CFD2C34|nr:metallophosphoesterase family protein [Metabacillus litoralis]
MKIIVIGDTHIPKRGKEIPTIVREECKNSDLIIHVGDWQTIDVYNELKNLGQVEGVYGNVDSSDLLEVLPFKKILTIKNKRIGVVHGHGKSQTTEKREIFAFKEDSVNCILFGHSHIPSIKYINDVLLFNPGSATDKRKQQYFSFGILTIDNEINAKVVYFK